MVGLTQCKYFSQENLKEFHSVPILILLSQPLLSFGYNILIHVYSLADITALTPPILKPAQYPLLR